MKISKFHVGMVLAIVCVGMLVSAFFVPWWTIEADESLPPPPAVPTVYVNSTHDFRLLGISTSQLIETRIPGDTPEERTWSNSYSEIEDSELDAHFQTLLVLVTVGTILAVLFPVFHLLSRRKAILKSLALVLGFAVIFVMLGSATYLHVNVPSEVGNSRAGLKEPLEIEAPDIQTFAGSDYDQTPLSATETTWGPSLGWYSTFVVCVIMLFAIWFTESRPKTEEEPEEEPED